MIHALVPDHGPPDMRGIRRYAGRQARAARREGRLRDALVWGRVLRKTLRALRFAARLRAGLVRDFSHSSHSLFSETPEKIPEPPAPTAAPDPDRRRTFREGRLRC
jgi:hypothetical protein